MLQWLKGKRTQASPATGVLSEAADLGAVHWREGTTLPIPDWELQSWPESDDAKTLHRHANGLAAAWLDATIAALPVPHARAESDNFMLMSSLAPRQSAVLLDYLERSRRRVLATLPGIAADEGHGKSVVMVFVDEETYYRYVANYGSESPEPEAFSGGMFIDAGYGHFVFAEGPFESMERVVVHELTHCLVRHLPIPAWLNEGLAVNTEQRYVPTSPRYRANELEYLFGRFWSPVTIQEFWSGKSFLRPDDGQPLSYELARLLVQLLDKNYHVLAQYCASASYEDGGEAAMQTVLGMSLQDVMEAVLGPGEWKPDPAAWMAGTEKGQF
jgi:hypothetical protein